MARGPRDGRRPSPVPRMDPPACYIHAAPGGSTSSLFPLSPLIGFELHALHRSAPRLSCMCACMRPRLYWYWCRQRCAALRSARPPHSSSSQPNAEKYTIKIYYKNASASACASAFAPHTHAAACAAPTTTPHHPHHHPTHTRLGVCVRTAPPRGAPWRAPGARGASVDGGPACTRRRTPPPPAPAPAPGSGHRAAGSGLHRSAVAHARAGTSPLPPPPPPPLAPPPPPPPPPPCAIDHRARKTNGRTPWRAAEISRGYAARAVQASLDAP